jgi:16S rRNA pseudouridine516 synthase
VCSHSRSHLFCFCAQVPKLYEASLSSDLPADAADTFARGVIVLDGAPCAPAELRPTGPRAAEVVLTEGRYHQVKRMFASQARPSRNGQAWHCTCNVCFHCRALICSVACTQGCVVTRLHRARFGEYGVEGLAPGEWRVLPLPAWCASALAGGGDAGGDAAALAADEEGGDESEGAEQDK